MVHKAQVGSRTLPDRPPFSRVEDYSPREEHLTSILPGRINASSRSSFLLVMPTTRTFWRFTSPSILLRIWFVRPGQASNPRGRHAFARAGWMKTREPHTGHHVEHHRKTDDRTCSPDGE